MIIVGPFQLKYNILFYSILFYSILFYSILFYSIIKKTHFLTLSFIVFAQFFRSV